MADDPPKTEEPDEEQSGSSLLIDVVDQIVGRLAETLPARVARNLLRAVDVTLAGGVDLWAEQIASWRAGVKAKADARADAWLAAGHAAGAAVKGDPELGVRAAHFLLGNAIKNQERREDVQKRAARILSDDPPADDADRDIDEDWLLHFARIAERVSKEDLQEVLARMLAGEIKRPGAFSPFTLQIMSVLTSDVANVFQRAANLSIDIGHRQSFILAEPFGDAGSNALAPLGLPYFELKSLETIGLILDVTGWRTIKLPPRSSIEIHIAGKNYSLKNSTEGELDLGSRVRTVHFSRAGAELLEVIAKDEVPEYMHRVLEYFQEKGAQLRPT